jgi:hypothetical protein
VENIGLPNFVKAALDRILRFDPTIGPKQAARQIETQFCSDPLFHDNSNVRAKIMDQCRSYITSNRSRQSKKMPRSLKTMAHQALQGSLPFPD